MAKRLGFGPDALVRARPDPKQRWKLPVKDWVRELHQKRFGHVIGEKPLAPVPEWDEVAPGRLSRMEEILPPDGDWPRDEDVPF